MQPIMRSDGAIINALELRAADVSHKKVLCPCCHEFVFKMWPEGWDGHSGYKCSGLAASAIDGRKGEFKTRFGFLFRYQ
jgi:hypothetical protein